MTAAIEVHDVSKRFRLQHERYSSLKERAIHFGRVTSEDFWALQNVSFDVEEGTTVGLLGHNGSGKSTLLKCMAGILLPTSGEIRTRGRVAALLELGAGFHPDLSGRDNVYLNASLLGLSKKEVDGKFDEIVAFAELEPFIDNQVKYYSSGMYVRLGFAVAVNTDPDILIVDEVLAVGDEMFQRKCLDRVKLFQREGRTIIVVTHAADTIRKVCDYAGVLDKGTLVAYGEPGDAVRAFREHLMSRKAEIEASQLGDLMTLVDDDEPDESESDEEEGDDPHGFGERPDPGGRRHYHRRRSQALRITSVSFDYPEERGTAQYLMPGESLGIRIRYHAQERVEDVVPGLAVYNLQGDLLFAANSLWFPADIVIEPGDGEITFVLKNIPLLDGDYPVTIGLTTADEGTVYDWQEQLSTFSVMNPTPNSGVIFVDAEISNVRLSGPGKVETTVGAPAARVPAGHSLAEPA